MIIRTKMLRKHYSHLSEEKFQELIAFLTGLEKQRSVNRRNELREFYGGDKWWRKPYPLARNHFRKIRRKRIMIKKSKQRNRK